MFPAVIFALTPLLMVIASVINKDILLYPYKTYYFIAIVVAIPLAIIDTILVITGKAAGLLLASGIFNHSRVGQKSPISVR